MNILKSGSCSVVLCSEFYKNFLPEKKDKLVKVTKIIKNHNEYKQLKDIRLIDNYEKYFCIPDELIHLLNPSDSSYKYIKDLFINEKTNMFHGVLTCSYVNYGGDKELFDTITDLIDNYDYTYWSSYQKILKFTKYILEGLQFLHKNKLCHLDIKPENIIVNTSNNTYKIVDFGFCDKEPFDEFITDFRGTPGYFPRHSTKKTKRL
jgi:serine/threonine protein kinase